ncbi:unnamed protein product, partial [Protopolystoma xenopodis]
WPHRQSAQSTQAQPHKHTNTNTKSTGQGGNDRCGNVSTTQSRLCANSDWNNSLKSAPSPAWQLIRPDLHKQTTQNRQTSGWLEGVRGGGGRSFSVTKGRRKLNTTSLRLRDDDDVLLARRHVKKWQINKSRPAQLLLVLEADNNNANNRRPNLPGPPPHNASAHLLV